MQMVIFVSTFEKIMQIMKWLSGYILPTKTELSLTPNFVVKTRGMNQIAHT